MNKRCQYPGCPKHPSFGDAWSRRAHFCQTHKQPHHHKILPKAASNAKAGGRTGRGRPPRSGAIPAPSAREPVTPAGALSHQPAPGSLEPITQPGVMVSSQGHIPVART